MYIFLCILFLFALILEFSNRDTRRVISLFVFVVIVFFYGMRWETGTDWLPYKEYFDNISFDYFEPGYKALTVVFRKFTDKYSLFLIFHAIVVFGSIYIYISKNFKFKSLALISVFVFMFPYMGASRQFLALGFAFIALGAFKQRNLKRAFIFIIIASLFHQTAILFLCMFFVKKIRLTNRDVILSVVLILILRFFVKSGLDVLLGISLPRSITVRLEQYIQYFPLDWVHFGLGIVRKLIPLVLLCLSDRDEETKLYKFMYLFAIFFYIIPYGFAQIFVSRFTLYFEMFGYLGLIKIIEKKPSNWRGFAGLWLFVLLIIIHLALSVKTNFSLYFPYKGLLINSGYFRVLY